ncbi:MAG: AAA domain-containing protein [Bacteroidota bacterium]
METVDSYQGSEMNYIIICLTRTGKPNEFMATTERINVATTRCKRGMVILGDYDACKGVGFYKHACDVIEEFGERVDGVDFL